MKYTVDDIPEPYTELRKHLRISSDDIVYIDQNKSYITIAVCYSKDSVLLYQSFAKIPAHWDYIVIGTKNLDVIKKAALGLQA